MFSWPYCICCEDLYEDSGNGSHMPAPWNPKTHWPAYGRQASRLLPSSH
jgi:hypothetical protein